MVKGFGQHIIQAFSGCKFFTTSGGQQTSVRRVLKVFQLFRAPRGWGNVTAAQFVAGKMPFTIKGPVFLQVSKMYDKLIGTGTKQKMFIPYFDE